MKNLFSDVPDSMPEELTEVLAGSGGVRIERIVSTGHSSPDNSWYDQAEAEWVIVLKGKAMLRFEDEDSGRVMMPGDYVHISPHRRHRLEWTTDDEPTVWLAVFYPES